MEADTDEQQIGKRQNESGQESKIGQSHDSSREVKTSQSAGTRKASKTFKVLETQGIIVGKTLGGGSYAKVKSAYDVNRKERVALKIINKKKSIDDYLTTFLPREIEAMRILGNHYALIRFYQIIETTNRYFFVMELADGGDLLTKIKMKKYIEEPQAGQWFVNLYDGIKYMHLNGIVHRDIKCENLLLDSKSTLKITDFGFCKKISKSGNSAELSETYCGSYAYAPPEILRGTAYNPELSDVWSMGVVLFTMLYGRLPFDDRDHKVLLKQVHSRVMFPTKPKVSEECQRLISKVLMKFSERMPLSKFMTDSWFKLNVCLAIHNSKKPEDTPTGSAIQDQGNYDNKISAISGDTEGSRINDNDMKIVQDEGKKSIDLMTEKYKLQGLEQKKLPIAT